MTHTARLRLRPVQTADIEALHEHWATPHVRKFLFDGIVEPVSAVADVIADSVNGFPASGNALWIANRGSEFVGSAGLRPLRNAGTEVYYSVAPHMLGRGYASEAARWVLRYAFDVLRLDKVVAEIDVDNVASISVVSALGMRVYETVPGVLGPMNRYVVTASGWATSRERPARGQDPERPSTRLYPSCGDNMPF